MTKLYFDILNDDILLIIISKYEFILQGKPTLNDFIHSSFRIKRMMQNENNCATIVKYKNKSLYNFIRDIKNISPRVTWRDVLMYGSQWEPLTREYALTKTDNPSGILNTLCSYYLSVKYSKFYTYISDINLDNLACYNKQLSWIGVYVICEDFKEYKFINGDFSITSYRDLNDKLLDRISDIKSQPILSHMLLLYSFINLIMFTSDTRKVLMSLIPYLVSFLYSADVYVKLVDATKHRLLDRYTNIMISKGLTWSNEMKIPGYIFDMFISDMNLRLGLS